MSKRGIRISKSGIRVRIRLSSGIGSQSSRMHFAQSHNEALRTACSSIVRPLSHELSNKYGNHETKPY
jgi:hypothetical protein